MWPWSQQNQREKQLLRQWRQGRRQTSLRLLPLRLLLWKLQRDTADSLEASPVQTDSLLDRLKHWLPIGARMRTGNAPLGPSPQKCNQSPRRSLPPFLVQLQRRLMVLLLVLAVRLLRRSFRGSRTR